MKWEKATKDTQIGEKEIKLSLFADDMIIYPKKSIQSDNPKKFQKSCKIQINTQKSITFFQQWAMLSIFSCVCWPFVCPLWTNVCLGLLSILWVVCLSDTKLFAYFGDWSLTVALFAIIFSHVEDYLFILFILSFAVEKLLSLIRSYLFIYVFISITLQSGSKRILRDLCQRIFCPWFPLRVYSCSSYI